MPPRARVVCDCGKDVAVSRVGWPMRHRTPAGDRCTAGFAVATRVDRTSGRPDDEPADVRGTVADDRDDGPDVHVGRGPLAVLNALAGCHLTIMTATPERVRHAIEAAVARVVADVDAQAAQDRRDRPRPIIFDDGSVDVDAVTAIGETMTG